MRCEWRDSDGALDDERWTVAGVAVLSAIASIYGDGRWTYARLRGYHGPLTTRSVASVLRMLRLRWGGRR